MCIGSQYQGLTTRIRLRKRTNNDRRKKPTVFTAFGYFEDEDNRKVLANIYRALRPDGKLAFDTFNRDVLLKGFQPYIVTEKEGNLMIDRNTFDTFSGRMYNQRIVIRDGVRKKQTLLRPDI